ncbi:DUF5688 family protein [Lachnospiraceae bacterium LCP19S3_B12]
MTRHQIKTICWKEFVWRRSFKLEQVHEMLAHLATVSSRGAVIWEIRARDGFVRHLLGADPASIHKITEALQVHGDIEFYPVIDAVDMVSLDIKLHEIMDAANKNCEKAGYNIMLMEDAISEITGMEILSETFCPMYVGTNPERILGASILMYETYLEDLATQIEDDLCIAPSSIHEVLIFPLSLVNPARIIEIVRDVNRTVVLPQEKLSDSVYIYRRGTHVISQAALKNPDNLTCEENTRE